MKISPLTIYTIGISLSLVAISAGAFGVFGNGGALPNAKEAKLYADRYQELVGVAQQMPQAEKRVETAISLVNGKAAEWNRVVSTRTPQSTVAAGGIDVSVNPWQLSVDTKKFRNNVQRAVNAQVKKGGIRVINGPTVPGIDDNMQASQILSSYYNFPAVPFPVVIYDLGTVTVDGTYAQIMANVRAYANMPNYLAVADGLALTGTSPRLRATYNLSIVGFIRGKEVFPNVPESGGGATGGSRGMGGFGGAMGGMSGPMGGMSGPMGGAMGGMRGPMAGPTGASGGARGGPAAGGAPRD